MGTMEETPPLEPTSSLITKNLAKKSFLQPTFPPKPSTPFPKKVTIVCAWKKTSAISLPWMILTEMEWPPEKMDTSRFSLEGKRSPTFLVTLSRRMPNTCFAWKRAQNPSNPSNQTLKQSHKKILPHRKQW